MLWNSLHQHPNVCTKCVKHIPQEILNSINDDELNKLYPKEHSRTNITMNHDPQHQVHVASTPSVTPETTPTPTPVPEPTSKVQSKIAAVTAFNKSANNIEKDNGETTMATQTTTTTTPSAVQTLLSITSDRNASFLTNVMNAATAGAELGAAGAASGSATDFVIKRVGKTWPVAGAFIAGTPLIRPAMDFVVPLGVGIVTWNKMVPGVSPERQEKIANWCLISISSHVDTIMSKIGRDFFSSLFKHMENTVADWNSNPLGN